MALLLRKLDLYESTSQTEIDGAYLGQVTVPIQEQTVAAYTAAINAAPIIRDSGYYSFCRLYKGRNYSAGEALPAYLSVMRPELWAGIIAWPHAPNQTLTKLLEMCPHVYYRDDWTPGMFYHLTYNGSNYGYVSQILNPPNTATFQNIYRVDYRTGEKTGCAGYEPAANLFGYCSTTNNDLHFQPADYFLDRTQNLLGYASNLRTLWSYYVDYLVHWYSGNTAYGPRTYPTSNVHAAWLLGAPGEERESLYLYLYGDASGKIYSYQDGLQFEVADGLSAESFGAYGMLAPPGGEILSALDRPKVYRWTDLMPSALPLTAKVWAIPTENTVESIVDLSQAVTMISITAQYSGDVRVSYSYDNGGTWTEPRPMAEFLQIPMSQIWRGMGDDKKIRFRLALESSDAELKQFLVKWGRENNGA